MAVSVNRCYQSKPNVARGGGFSSFFFFKKKGHHSHPG